MMSLADAPGGVKIITDETVASAAGPAPDSHAGDPRHIDPATLAKFDTLCSRMGLIADAVNTFADPTLRERAFYELVGIINPSPDDDAAEAGQHTDFWFRGHDLDRLTEWIADQAPMAWRESVQANEPTATALIRFLDQGAQAWTQILLVKHALMTAGGFSAEQVDGDLAALIREMASDTPISPEIEALAVRLQARAKPGETAPQVALRLLDMLSTEEDLRREQDKVDDRERAGE